MIKYIKYLLILFVLQLVGLSDISANLQEDIDPVNGTNSLNPTTGNVTIGGFFTWLRGELFVITFVIAVAVFVFIGIRMVTARGNPEEFKKAWLHFVYAIIGIFFVFSAWGIVNLIANLGENF